MKMSLNSDHHFQLINEFEFWFETFINLVIYDNNKVDIQITIITIMIIN